MQAYINVCIHATTQIQWLQVARRLVLWLADWMVGSKRTTARLGALVLSLDAHRQTNMYSTYHCTTARVGEPEFRLLSHKPIC